jgi:hypothetical protein
MLLKGLKSYALGGLMAVALAIIGCGGSGNDTSTTGSTSGARGTLAVRLADAPDPSISALNITVNRVEANIDGQWVSIPVSETTVDLLDLVQNDILLASGSVPTGTYNQVRVFVTNATVTDADGTHDVTIPSAEQTGIKLNVNYTINANEVTALLLDFNVGKSLIKTGNGTYKLQPVIPVVVKVASGTVSGMVHDSTGAVADNVDVKATYTAGGSYPLGTVVNTSYTLDDGTFKVWALLPGTYTLTFTRTVGDTTQTVTVTDVVVTAGQNTDVGVVTIE